MKEDVPPEADDAVSGVVKILNDAGGRETLVVDGNKVNTVSGRDIAKSDAIGLEDSDSVVVETVAGTIEVVAEDLLAAIMATKRDGDAAAAAIRRDGGGS
jgi:hypothetical protein